MRKHVDSQILQMMSFSRIVSQTVMHGNTESLDFKNKGKKKKERKEINEGKKRKRKTNKQTYHISIMLHLDLLECLFIIYRYRRQIFLFFNYRVPGTDNCTITLQSSCFTGRTFFDGEYLLE